MAWISYPIATGTKLYAITITGGNLAASALTLADGTNVDGAHPLPVTAAVTSLPAVTFAAPQHVIVDSLPSVTIANPTDVSALATATLQGTGNTSLASILTKLGDVLTALQGTLTTAGTSTVSGTVAATQSGAWSTGITGTLPAFASPPSVAQSGAWSVTASGTVAVSALPAVTFAAPQHVIVDSAPTTAVTVATLPALTTGAATIGAVTGPAAVALAKDLTLTDGTQRGTFTVANPTDVSALATSTKQDTGNTSLASLVTANHVDLAAILAKIVAAPALDATLTGGAQIAQIGAGGSSSGAWTVARYGSASGATSLGTGTVVVKNSACRVRSIFMSNKTGVAVWLGLTNSATAIANASVPDIEQSLGNATGSRVFDFGETGIYMSAGACVSVSKTQQSTDSTTTLTNLTVTINYL